MESIVNDPMNSEEQFVAAAVRRIYRWMAACAVAGTLVVLIWKGPRYGGGFATGAALSILNFHWMKDTRYASSFADILKFCRDRFEK